jgi:hypothetical protein
MGFNKRPGMREERRVLGRIDVRIVGSEIPDLVDAVLDRIELRLITQVPLPEK